MIYIITMVFLLLVIVFLLVYMTLVNRNTTQERNKFINVIISRDARDLAQLETIAKIKPIETTVPAPNFIPESDLSDAEFDKIINEGLDGE